MGEQQVLAQASLKGDAAHLLVIGLQKIGGEIIQILMVI